MNFYYSKINNYYYYITQNKTPYEAGIMTEFQEAPMHFQGQAIPSIITVCVYIVI